MAKSKKTKKSPPVNTPTSPLSEVRSNLGLQSALENLKLDGELSDGGFIGVGIGLREEELSPRLLALQQQLEKLDQDRYLLQKAAQNDVAPLSTLNSSANKTELSLQSLKKRLGEVRQQLYGSTGTSPGSLSNLAKSYFGGIIRGGTTTSSKRHANGAFPGEGEAFDEGDLDETEFEFEISESEYYEEELISEAAEAAATDRLLDATRLGLRLFGPNDVSVTGTFNGVGGGTVVTDNDLISKVESEIESILEMITSSDIPNDRKLDLMNEKFANIVKQDRQLRVRVDKARRIAHDERIQRQLLEIELDKANAIKQRLESLCRDLHNENRRIKAEGVKREELAAAAAAVSVSTQPEAKVEMEFMLPSLPDTSDLIKEPSPVLADKIVQLSDLYNSREQYFATFLRQKETQLIMATERADLLASQLGKQSSTLEMNSRRITALTRSEQELKTQVRQYVEKFRQVEETLGKSNDLFGTFRAEMEQMGAKLARLERENAQLNSKCATLSRNIIEMADERTKQNASIDTLKGQKAKLEQLCRTLQAERNAALKCSGVTVEENANVSPLPPTTQ